MLATIKVILDIGRALFGLRGDMAKGRSDRKPAVAAFLAGIAETIENASAQLKSGVYPQGSCHELLLHSQRMEKAIGDLVGVAEASRLGQALERVHRLEDLHAEASRLTEAERVANFAELDRAAAEFRATAAFVRVSP